MGNPDLMQADPEELRRAADQAVVAVGDLSTTQTKLQGLVDDAQPPIWSGTAVMAFRTAHEEWSQGLTRLIVAMGELGDGVLITGNNYDTTELDNAARIGSAQGTGAYG